MPKLSLDRNMNVYVERGEILQPIGRILYGFDQYGRKDDTLWFMSPEDDAKHIPTLVSEKMWYLDDQMQDIFSRIENWLASK
jgi:hypothetical protein